MIGSLTGKVRGTNIIQTSSGVGYTVNASVPLIEGENVDLLITTIVREDAFNLYGFELRHEQALFEALIKVNRVGPVLAMNILRELGFETVLTSIKNSDGKTLSKAKGLGIKQAELICSSIKLPDELAIIKTDEKPSSLVLTISQSLERLGYSEKDSLEAAKVASNKTDDLNEVVKEALNYLKREGN